MSSSAFRRKTDGDVGSMKNFKKTISLNIYKKKGYEKNGKMLKNKGLALNPFFTTQSNIIGSDAHFRDALAGDGRLQK